MVFGLSLEIQPLTVTVQSEGTDVGQSMLQRDSRALLGMEVESPSTNTALVTLPCSEHPDDTPASRRQTKLRVEVTGCEKEGNLQETGIAEVIAEEIRLNSRRIR